jgi:hypothetical protein
MQSDPIGLGGGVNTYAYLNGSGGPLSNTDSLGLSSDGGTTIRIPCPGACPIYLGTIDRLTNTRWDSVSDDGDGRGRGRDFRSRESSTPQNCPPSKEDCEKQWTEARLVCRSLIYEQMQQRAGRRKKRSVTGVTGGCTDVEQCVRGW